MSHQWKVEHKYPEFLSEEEEVSSEAATTNGHSLPYLEVRGFEAILTLQVRYSIKYIYV